ncbi:carboxypeptidase-like regulatory domain-containing protein [Hymenobacter sp. B81]|uniref:carboxypeptidase-like regulatory domain-containing protein n=1 Tax=Hymenobacter sp. B81 TaxID=3344878 RepID=UPI0037DD986B
MQVQVDGRSVTAETDAAGNFTLTGLPIGSPTLQFNRPGYGRFVQTVEVTKDNTPAPPVRLGELPTTVFSTFDITPYGASIVVHGTISPRLTQPQAHRLFVGSDFRTLSNTNYLLSVGFTAPAGADRFQDTISSTVLRGAGLQSFALVYITAYADNPMADTYIDATSGRRIYPATAPPSLGSTFVNLP